MAKLKLDDETMLFPSVPRVVYERNPLQQVTCGLHFPSILEIKTKAPAEFQSRIRTEYPFYKEESPEVPDPHGEMPAELLDILKRLALEASPSHKFGTEDRARIVTLSESSFVFEDNAYVRREAFLAELKRLESEFFEIYKPARYTRIGLRYVNFIDPRTLHLVPADWSKWVQPGLLGLVSSRPNISKNIVQTRNQVEFSFEGFWDGTVDANCILRHGLAQLEDEAEEKGEKPDASSIYIIDIDFYSKLPRKGEKPDVFGIIEAFSEQARRLFRACITDELHIALVPLETQG